MRIEVTEEDIQYGCRCDPDCCPVGRALSRAGLAHLGVLGTAVRVECQRQEVVLLVLPEEVQNWILCFDGYGPVSPFSFELELPQEAEAWPQAA